MLYISQWYDILPTIAAAAEASIPTDRILVETDSPYLSPEPLRGKSNEPSHILHTVKFLSKIKKIDHTLFSKITTDNFFRIFGNLK